jgi:hypothetical protein
MYYIQLAVCTARAIAHRTSTAFTESDSKASQEAKEEGLHSKTSQQNFHGFSVLGSCTPRRVGGTVKPAQSSQHTLRQCREEEGGLEEEEEEEEGLHGVFKR